MKVEFDDAQKQVLDEMLLKLPGARAGKMFGFPGSGPAASSLPACTGRA